MICISMNQELEQSLVRVTAILTLFSVQKLLTCFSTILHNDLIWDDTASAYLRRGRGTAEFPYSATYS